MTEVVEGSRLYFPPEDPVNAPDDRKVMHPETDASQVLMADGSTLEESLGGGGIVVSDTKPETACIWAKVTEKVTVDSDDD
jgi:hypothetical protein